MLLRLSPTATLKVQRNLEYTPGRDLRLPYPVELDPLDYPLGTTLVSALLIAESEFNESPLLSKLITTVVSANGQITDSAADGEGALYFALTPAETNAFVGPVAFEVIVVDSLGRQASLETGALVRASTTQGAPVDHVIVAPDPASVLEGQSVQLTATLYDVDSNVLTGRTIVWSSSDVSIATVSQSGLATGLTNGAAIITATSEGRADLSTLTVSEYTPAAFRDEVNAEVPAVQMEHCLMAGYGHTTTTGRKVSVTDTVAGGDDGAVALVTSEGGSAIGLYYDAAVPYRLRPNGDGNSRSGKIVFPSDLSHTKSRWIARCGFWDIGDNNNNRRTLLSHDGTGNYDPTTATGGNVIRTTGFGDTFGGYMENVPVDNGAQQQYGQKRPYHGLVIEVFDREHNASDLPSWTPSGGTYGEQYRLFGRDARCWHVADRILGARTVEELGEPEVGPRNADYLHWTVTGRGVPTATVISLLNRVAELPKFGCPADTRRAVMVTGNSIGVQLGTKVRDLINQTTYMVNDLSVANMRFDHLLARFSRAEALCINDGKRPLRIWFPYEVTNSLGSVIAATAAECHALYVQLHDAILTAHPGDVILNPTAMARVADANGATLRAEYNVLQRAFCTARNERCCDIGADAFAYGYQAAASEPAKFYDGIHLTEQGRIDVATKIIADINAFWP